jgi:hypothetical protein
MKHILPTPNDAYCDACGLAIDFWPMVEECPARPMPDKLGKALDDYKSEPIKLKGE